MKVPTSQRAKIKRYSNLLTPEVTLGVPAVDGLSVIFDDHRLTSMDQLVADELIKLLDPGDNVALAKTNLTTAVVAAKAKSNRMEDDVI